MDSGGSVKIYVVFYKHFLYTLMIVKFVFASADIQDGVNMIFMQFFDDALERNVPLSNCHKNMCVCVYKHLVYYP